MELGDISNSVLGVSPGPGLTSPEDERRIRNYGNRLNAQLDLGLTPQEENLWSHHTGNVDQGGYQQPGGGNSSLYTITEGVGDRSYVLPTIYDSQMIEPDEALKRAIAAGINKFPSYATQDQADERYRQMHGYLERDEFKPR